MPGWTSNARRDVQATRDYTTPAVITMALYFLFYVPGLVANLVYLHRALQEKRQQDVQVKGLGCLIALVLTLGAPALIVAMMIAFAVGSGALLLVMGIVGVVVGLLFRLAIIVGIVLLLGAGYVSVRHGPQTVLTMIRQFFKK